MAAFKHGQDLPEMTIKAILGEVTRHATDRPVICDGFPVVPEHLCRIPSGATVIEITCESETRELRLKERECQTLRKWTPGITSLRDSQLPSLHDAATLAGVTYLKIDNTASSTDMIREVAFGVIRSC